MLSVVEGSVLAPTYIDQLVLLLETGGGDDVATLKLERERLLGEVANLVNSIAGGQSKPDSIATAIRQRETVIRSLDARIRAPREAPNRERLRAALEQRAVEWRATLRAEPKIARMMLRRLIGPMTLWNEADRPEWVRWEAPAKPASLVDGLEQGPANWVASPPGIEPGSRP